MTDYQIYKARARQKAIDWQADFHNHNYGYFDLVKFEEYFTRIGTKYGLLKEFKANGII